jgi:redox-sensitive bicupin YhaK (pirin superfamily)
MHRDSIGSAQRIEPGALNWMTAGRGIVHSERAPDDLRGTAYTNHGLQLWAALPAAHEEAAPAFSHTPASAIPAVGVDGAEIRVLIGEAFGEKSPVATFSQTVYLDIRLSPGARLALPPLAEELAVYPVDGDLQIDGEPVAAHTLAVLSAGAASVISADAPVRLVVIGGEPLDGHRFMWWNFVSSRRERIVQASDEWEAQTMGHVPGETELIPLPERRFVPG